MRGKLARGRHRLRQQPVANLAYRIGVAVVGLAVLAIGLLAIPYPGPGWAIVFVGLAILATEFIWARRVLTFVRERYDGSMVWFRAQGLWLQVAGVVFTTAVVLATMWLLGVLGWIAALLGVESAWLRSPIGVGP